jgi:hypothetical protein
MKPEVVKMPVPTILATTMAMAENRPIFPFATEPAVAPDPSTVQAIPPVFGLRMGYGWEYVKIDNIVKYKITYKVILDGVWRAEFVGIN